MMLPAVMLITAAVCLEPVQLSVTSREEPVVGTITSTTDQGIHLQLEDQRALVVPWYELRAGLVPEGVEPGFQELASQAWRAHERLARGDIQGALPLYQSLARTFLWRQGPQSRDVSEGLSKCLIAIGSRKRAIEPMLASFAAEGLPGTEILPVSDRIDTDLRVCRDFPPIFTGDDSSRLDELREASKRLQLMHAYYALVASSSSSRGQWVESIIELKRSLGARDAGLVLIEQVSFAQAHPDESVRRGAREALRRRTQTQGGTWIEVWARLAIGNSLIRDADELQRDQGLIELIHVVVRLGEIEPELTLFAAEIASEYLNQTDRAVWGSTITQQAQQNIQGGNGRSVDTGVSAP
jgi:hypothetical protein